MLIKSKKGFSLIELLIALAIVGIVSPIIFIVFVSGIEDYSTTTKYVDQQYTVMEVTRLIRQDVEEAKTITFEMDSAPGSLKVNKIKFEFSASPAKPSRIWKFESGTVSGKIVNGLWLSVDGGTTYVLVIDKLNLGESKFELDTTSLDPSSVTSRYKTARLILSIRPEQLNKTKYKGRNVNENIITEFSVRYKDIKFGTI